ncbi:phosphatase PAP2 family protein [Devosia sp. Naph2]|uniref:phosphatase PAP2 family protein n=1 Tax=Devosia polycyclovorans TaxID=3345148 RepID=UPI0035D041CF
MVHVSVGEESVPRNVDNPKCVAGQLGDLHMLYRLVRRTHLKKAYKFVTAEVRLLAAIAIVSGLILGFFTLADAMGEGDLEAFDNFVLMVFRDPDNVDLVVGPIWAHEMVRDITALGSFSLLGLIVLGVCSYLLLIRLKSEALLIVVSVAGGTILSTVLKWTYSRPRPDLHVMSTQFTSSFPSGHAMLSAVTFLTLGTLLAKIAPSWSIRLFFLGGAIFLTVIVGLSRVYMGVHFPSDVIAGWCVGAAWALLCNIVATILQRRGELRGAYASAKEPAEPARVAKV